MHQIEGQYTLEDYRQAIALHGRKGAFTHFISIAVSVLFGLILVAATVLTLLGHIPGEYYLPTLLFFAAYLGMTYLYVPYQVKRVFGQQPELQKPFRMEFNPEQAVFRNEYGEVKIPWKELVKWAEDERILLLYNSDVLFRMLPKRMFSGPAAVEYIRARLAESNIPPAAKVRNPLRELVTIVLLLFVIVLAIYNFFLNQ